MTSRVRMLDSDLPIVAAPMAGGVTTVALAAAVAAAGAFPFLAGGYKTADVLAVEIATLRERHNLFGVNLFVPARERIDVSQFVAYAEELRSEFERYGLTPDLKPLHDDDSWHEKVAILRDNPVPVVSLTFGLPPKKDIASLQKAGSSVLVTVTTPAEALAAAEAGVDGLIIQGPTAGGHSATFDPHRTIVSTPTVELVRAIASAVTLPRVAAGGVDGPDAVRRLLAVGVEAVAVGTLLLRTDESGASQAHKDALADPRYAQTTITRAFTGRPARGLRNDFIKHHDRTAPVGYPELHHLTRALRAAAARAGDTDRLHLWAGTGYRAARVVPVASVIADLAASIEAAGSLT